MKIASICTKSAKIRSIYTENTFTKGGYAGKS